MLKDSSVAPAPPIGQELREEAHGSRAPAPVEVSGILCGAGVARTLFPRDKGAAAHPCIAPHRATSGENGSQHCHRLGVRGKTVPSIVIDWEKDLNEVRHDFMR